MIYFELVRRQFFLDAAHVDEVCFLLIDLDLLHEIRI